MSAMDPCISVMFLFEHLLIFGSRVIHLQATRYVTCGEPFQRHEPGIPANIMWHWLQRV